MVHLLASPMIFLVFVLLYSAQGRKFPRPDWGGFHEDDHFWIYEKQAGEIHKHDDARVHDVFWIYRKKTPEMSKANGQNHAHHRHHDMTPSHHIFFTLGDLKTGKTMPLYFPRKPDSSRTPRLLPKDEAESIPFSFSQLSQLLDYFSFGEQSPQARAMAYTLETCEQEPIKGEVKYCATSLESILVGVQQILGPGTKSRTLTTTYLTMEKTSKPLQNYTILETPKQVAAQRMVACHPMPYPYAVFYCHSQLHSENRLFEVALSGPNGERVESFAVCHMDTSEWGHNHASFRVLNIEPGSSPVCHFFPVDSIVWVPMESNVE